jgi:hypothetical protein
LSLVLAWLVGAGAVIGGAYTLSLFKATPGAISLAVDEQSGMTEGQRTHEKEATEAYTSALHAAANRVLPLTIAELLIGFGMVVFAQRATLGRAWARHALVQMTVAHVALSGIAWTMTADLREPENALQLAVSKVDANELDGGTLKLANVTGLALGFVVGAITVLGLTLRGSRAFYEATPGLTEP